MEFYYFYTLKALCNGQGKVKMYGMSRAKQQLKGQEKGLLLVIKMDVMKFRVNTIVCGCTTKITLIDGVIKINYGIRLGYCIVKTVYVTYCKFSTCGCDLFNYTAIKLVAYTVKKEQ